jgi:hypothetical protein
MVQTILKKSPDLRVEKDNRLEVILGSVGI